MVVEEMVVEDMVAEELVVMAMVVEVMGRGSAQTAQPLLLHFAHSCQLATSQISSP